MGRSIYENNLEEQDSAVRISHIKEANCLPSAISSKSKTPLWKSPNLRLSLSLSLILLFHRLFHRFFVRLRANLLTQDAQPFRRRNPRISRVLVSKLSPAVGASLAGFFLGVYPGDQLRITIAIYIMTRALEFLYKLLEDDGWFKNRPWVSLLCESCEGGDMLTILPYSGLEAGCWLHRPWGSYCMLLYLTGIAFRKYVISLFPRQERYI